MDIIVMIIETLTPNEAARQWGLIGSLIKPACDYDISRRVTLEGLYNDVLSGHSIAIFFRNDGGTIEGAAVLTATDICVGKFLFVKVLGGNFDDPDWIVSANEQMEVLAVSMGCIEGVMFCGRPGWVKRLARLGYREVLVTMIKRIENNGRFIEQK